MIYKLKNIVYWIPIYVWWKKTLTICLHILNIIFVTPDAFNMTFNQNSMDFLYEYDCKKY